MTYQYRRRSIFAPLLLVILALALTLFFAVKDASAQVNPLIVPPTAAISKLDPTVDYRYAGVVLRDAKGNTLRSTKVINAFRKQYACPSTQKFTGACPGWAIDHPIPLDCGGVDAVWNMQWLPDEIKSAQGPFSKDHFERRIYGGNKISVGCP